MRGGDRCCNAEAICRGPFTACSLCEVWEQGCLCNVATVKGHAWQLQRQHSAGTAPPALGAALVTGWDAACQAGQPAGCYQERSKQHFLGSGSQQEVAKASPASQEARGSTSATTCRSQRPWSAESSASKFGSSWQALPRLGCARCQTAAQAWTRKQSKNGFSWQPDLDAECRSRPKRSAQTAKWPPHLRYQAPKCCQASQVSSPIS